MIERVYSRQQNHLPPWARKTACDICRRYYQIGKAGGAERVEGTMFCAQCPGGCRLPASPELIAEWRAWAAKRAEQWAKAEAEGEPIFTWRNALLRNNSPLSLPVAGGTGRMVG